MKQLRNQSDYWKPCRPGTILKVTDSKFERHRRRFLIQIAMAGVLAFFGLFSSVFLLIHRRTRALALNETSEPVREPKLQPVAANKSIEDEPLPADSIRLTCREIKQQLPQYVVAVRTGSDSRSLDQRELIRKFEQHLSVCPYCPMIVLKAVRSA
jgi:hypothetical protein